MVAVQATAHNHGVEKSKFQLRRHASDPWGGVAKGVNRRMCAQSVKKRACCGYTGFVLLVKPGHQKNNIMNAMKGGVGRSSCVGCPHVVRLVLLL
jgi:hypothetical protein